jgi:hypothetical protein
MCDTKGLSPNSVEGTSTLVRFEINLNASGAVLYAPEAGAVLSGVVELVAQPIRGAWNVDFYVDGRLLVRSDDGARPVRQRWDTRTVADGTHMISVGGDDGNHDPPGPAIAVTVRNGISPSPTPTPSPTPSGPSITISEGAGLRPWTRFPGETRYTMGTATIRVSRDGGFTWTRRLGKKVYVVVGDADESVMSNRVAIDP